MSKTPETDKCLSDIKTSSDSELSRNLRAADDHVVTQIKFADVTVFQGAPLWHSWALREAFLAGISYERDRL